MLTVIIPVYQVELYLRECLDGILQSKYKGLEVILIDDGSHDHCPKICDEYAEKDSRFKVIHQKNTGVAVARNAGLDVAQGEWIWFVDSDDVVDMRPVGDIIKWLSLTPALPHKEGDNRKVDLVMFDLETFKENETLALRNSGLQFTDVDVHVHVCVDKNAFLSQHISFFHQQFWFRREIINKNKKELIHFSDGVRVAEDLERMYKYFTLCQQPVRFEATLYHYRVRETSVTKDKNYRKKAIEDLPIVLDNLAKWIRRYDIKPELWLDMRIMKLFQNLLYSASIMKPLDVALFQTQVRAIINKYRKLGFFFINQKKYRLAEKNVKVYFLLNKLFLKMKSNH